ncbi:MAG: histone deacetylase [Saprospiraceae bacterium]
MLKIAFHNSYKYALPEGHRFPMIKYELIPEQLLYEGTVHADNFFTPDQLTPTEILLTHTADYLQKLESQTLSEKEIRRIGFPMTPALIDRGKHISKGTFLCAQYALQYGVAMNIAGGTHHAFADFGEGFCIFNDIAIAANLMLSKGLAKKILIIDLDVHQGNGTANIFENVPEVFTFSMHGEKNFPTRKEKSDLDIGLEDQTGDQAYLSILKNTLPRLIDEVQPDFAFYLSGVDIISSDKLGRLSVSKAGCKERDRFTLSTLKNNGIPVAISMGGGYSPRVADIVDCHANTFRVAQEIFF